MTDTVKAADTASLAPVDALTTVEDFSPTDRAAAYDCFLNRAMSLDDVAITKGIDKHVLLAWAKQGKWVARKKALTEELTKSIEQKFQNWALDNKIVVAKSHLEYGQHLEKMVNDLVTKLKDSGKVTSTEIMRLCKALSEVSNVTARAVGLDNEGINPAQLQQQSQKQPLIIIGLKPIQSHEGTTLEAEYKEGEM